MEKLKWGIIGAGRIAGTFAKGLAESESGELLAVGSRSLEKSEKFGDEFGARHRYGSYEEVLADKGVDAVYIATLHPSHAELAIRAAEAGKHILCEKPLAMNHQQALEVVDAARRNDVFLMEAFMYRCHPQTKKLVELIRNGAIGEVRLIESRFSFDSGPQPSERLVKQELGGGAILDLGCYCASSSRLVAGAALGLPFADPVEMHAVGHVGESSRVDEYSTAILRFDTDIIAQLTTAFTANLGSYVKVTGTAGVIEVVSPWFCNDVIRLTRGEQQETIDATTTKSMYAIEADNVAANTENRQAPEVSWDDTLGNMRVLDQWRSDIGMVYDFEKALRA